MFLNVPKDKNVNLLRTGMTFSEARHHLEEKEYYYLKEIEDRRVKENAKRYGFINF